MLAVVYMGIAVHELDTAYRSHALKSINLHHFNYFAIFVAVINVLELWFGISLNLVRVL